MLFAFLTLGQWLLLGWIFVLVVLLPFPAARRYVRTIVRSVKTLVACLVLGALLVLTSIPIFFNAAYRLLGHQAQATVTKCEPTRNGTLVEYEFTDANGTPRTGKDIAAVGWTAPPSGTITVQYLPGREADARLSHGGVPWQVYAVFVGSGLLLVMLIALSVRRS